MYYSLQDGILQLQARCKQTNDVLVLIPSRKLHGDLPAALVDGHVHWLNLSTKIIEIRPLEQLWEQSLDNWRIDCASGQYRMYKGCETLVDIRSPTWAMVSICFRCLNNIDESLLDRRSSGDEDFLSHSRNLMITTSPIDSACKLRLCVTLPHYSLSFFVNEREELESCDFKDMIYDEDQHIGTLLDLENLLVLRSKTHIAGTLVPEALIPRRVLIPNGSPKEYGGHVQISAINTHYPTGSNEPLYHTYDVDTELGCLIGNGSSMSTRYLASLHAMTSRHSPDPLTGKTGAQAALCLLQSAWCRSIMKLKAFDDDDSEWTSTRTQYPQINSAYKEIRKRYYWDRSTFDHEPVSAPGKHTVPRATYLFPSDGGPTSLGDCDESKYSVTHIPAEHGVSTFAHSISFSDQCLPRQTTLDQLFYSCPAPELPTRTTLLCDSHNTSPDDIPILDPLFASLRADSSFQQEYLAHLDTSSQCVCVESQIAHKMTGENLIKALRQHYVQCRVNYLDTLEILKKNLNSDLVTADVLLRYLASASLIEVPAHWRKCLTSFALLLLELQRSRRLLRFALNGLEEELSKELENEGCDGWNPEEFPDWLLIQVHLLFRSTRLYQLY